MVGVGSRVDRGDRDCRWRCGSVGGGFLASRIRQPSSALCANSPELAPKPIVVADPLAFLELQHYAPSELRARIVYLADLPTALAVTGTDSADLSLLGLAKRVTPLQVVLPDQIKFNQAWLLGSHDSAAAQSLRSRGFQLRSTANVGVLDATRTFSQIH